MGKRRPPGLDGVPVSPPSATSSRVSPDSVPPPSSEPVLLVSPKHCSRGHRLQPLAARRRKRCTRCSDVFRGAYGICTLCDYIACGTCITADHTDGLPLRHPSAEPPPFDVDSWEGVSPISPQAAAPPQLTVTSPQMSPTPLSHPNTPVSPQQPPPMRMARKAESPPPAPAPSPASLPASPGPRPLASALKGRGKQERRPGLHALLNLEDGLHPPRTDPDPLHTLPEGGGAGGPGGGAVGVAGVAATTPPSPPPSDPPSPSASAGTGSSSGGSSRGSSSRLAGVASTSGVTAASSEASSPSASEDHPPSGLRLPLPQGVEGQEEGVGGEGEGEEEEGIVAAPAHPGVGVGGVGAGGGRTFPAVVLQGGHHPHPHPSAGGEQPQSLSSEVSSFGAPSLELPGRGFRVPAATSPSSSTHMPYSHHPMGALGVGGVGVPARHVGGGSAGESPAEQHLLVVRTPSVSGSEVEPAGELLMGSSVEDIRLPKIRSPDYSRIVPAGDDDMTTEEEEDLEAVSAFHRLPEGDSEEEEGTGTAILRILPAASGSSSSSGSSVGAPQGIRGIPSTGLGDSTSELQGIVVIGDVETGDLPMTQGPVTLDAEALHSLGTQHLLPNGGGGASDAESGVGGGGGAHPLRRHDSTTDMSEMTERAAAISHSIDQNMFGYGMHGGRSESSAPPTPQDPAVLHPGSSTASGDAAGGGVASEGRSYKLKQLLEKHKKDGSILRRAGGGAQSPRASLKRRKRRSSQASPAGSPLGISKLTLDQLVGKEESESGTSSTPSPQNRAPKKKKKEAGFQLDMLVNVVEALQKVVEKQNAPQPHARAGNRMSMHPGESCYELDNWVKTAHTAHSKEELLTKFAEEMLTIGFDDRQKQEGILRYTLSMPEMSFVELFRQLSEVAGVPQRTRIHPGTQYAHLVPFKKIIQSMNGADFTKGFTKNKRSGELFLHLCALVSEHKRCLQSGFKIENIAFDRQSTPGFTRVVSAPLHLLMILAKFGKTRDSHNASVLLSRVIRYINESCHEAAEAYEKDRAANEKDALKSPHQYEGAWVFEDAAEMVFVNNYMSNPSRIACSKPPEDAVESLQELMDGLRRHCSAEDEVSSPAHMTYEAPPGHWLGAQSMHTTHSSPRLPGKYQQICEKCGQLERTIEGEDFFGKGAGNSKDVCRVEGKHTLRALVNCSPLLFAAHMRLTSVVQQMLGGEGKPTGVVAREDDWIEGRAEDDADKFACERFVDIWNAAGRADLYFVKTEDGDDDASEPPLSPRNVGVRRASVAARDTTPVLHFILRSLPTIHAVLGNTMTKQERPGDVKSLARVWPASYSPGSGRGIDEQTYTSATDIDEALEVVRLLLSSCTFNRRLDTRDGNIFISVKEPQDVIPSSRLMRTAQLHYKITRYYDRCGLFSRSYQALGLGLLLQNAPTELSMLFSKGHMLYSPYDMAELNTLVSDPYRRPPTLLLQYRHLWACTRMGVELLVYDTGLTLLHWLCMIGDAALLASFFRGFEVRHREQREQLLGFLLNRTAKLGWTPVHCAVYSDSTECLVFLMDLTKRYFGAETLRHVADAPADISHMVVGNADRMIAAGIHHENLTQEHISNIAHNLIADPACDPSLAKHAPHQNSALYGSICITGLTPVHVASMFCHKDGMDVLLECGADPRGRTFLEELDAHDVAVAVHNRNKLQYEVKRQTDGVTSNEQKVHEATEEVIRASINRMHTEPGVKAKLSGMAARYSASSVLPHIVLCGLLFAYILFTRSDTDYYSANAMNEGILREEFVHETNVSLQVFKEIAEMDELHAWLQGPFYHQLFPSNVSAGLFLGYWELVGSIRVTQMRGSVKDNCQPPNWWYDEETPDVVRERYKNKCFTDTSEDMQGSWVHDIPYVSRATGQYWFLIPGNAPNISTIDIPNEPSTAKVLLKSLENELDFNTRAFILWMVAYNPSVNSFAVVTALIEMPLEGTLYPHWEVSVMPERLFFLSSAEIVYYVFFTAYLVIYLIYFTAEELLDAFSAKREFSNLRNAERRKGLPMMEDEVMQDEVSPQPSPQHSPTLLPDPSSVSSPQYLRSANPLMTFGTPSHHSSDPTQPFLSQRQRRPSVFGQRTSKEKSSKKRSPGKTKRVSIRDREKAIRARAIKDVGAGSEILGAMKNFFEVVILYLTEDWNFLDLLCLIFIYLGIFTHFMLLGKRASVQQELTDYPPFDPFGGETDHFFSSFIPFKDWVVQQNSVIAIVLILHFVKLLKYAQLLPVVGPVICAIVKTCTSLNVGVFLLVWQFLTITFVFGLNIIFGANMEGYKSLYDSFYTVQRHVLSDFDDFQKYYSTHTRLGPLLWLIFTYICHLLLLNLFIAVISVDYTENLGKATEDWAWTLLEKYKQRDLNLCDPADSASLIVWYKIGSMLHLTSFMKRGFNIKEVVQTKAKLEAEINSSDIYSRDYEFIRDHRHLANWNVVWPRVIQDAHEGDEVVARGHSRPAAAPVPAPTLHEVGDNPDREPQDERGGGGGGGEENPRRRRRSTVVPNEERVVDKARRMSMRLGRVRSTSHLSTESERFNRTLG